MEGETDEILDKEDWIGVGTEDSGLSRHLTFLSNRFEKNLICASHFGYVLSIENRKFCVRKIGSN